MPRNLLVSLLVLSSAVSAHAAGSAPPMRLTIQGMRAPRPERYLVGEPVQLTATLENLTGDPVKLAAPPRDAVKIHVAGVLRGDCMAEQLVVMGYLSPGTLGPHEKATVTLEAGDRGAVDAGEYEAWAEYRATNAPAQYLADEGIPSVQVLSERVHFEIVEPTGVDAEVLEKLGDACHRLPLLGEGAEEIVARYPYSSYAGLALGGLPVPKDEPERIVWVLRKRASLPPALAQDRGQVNARSYARRDLERKAEYLKHRPDSPDADRMELSIAYRLLEIGDTDNAKVALEELAAQKVLPTWLREQVTAVLAFAKEREASPSPPHLDEREER